MTTKEELIQYLIERGMFRSQANEIMEIAMPKIESEGDGYKITWNSPSSDYPAILIGMWKMLLKPIALEWIDTNKPQAWFREMFV
jgi:hypothetical protein